MNVLERASSAAQRFDWHLIESLIEQLMWSNFLKINEAVTRNEKTAKHLTYQEA